MKKIFSVKKFEESMIQREVSKIDIKNSKEIWAKKCDGKTEEEMLEMGCLTSNNWMIEVEN